MICFPCREGDHEECEGVTRHPTYCDCHHERGWRDFLRDLELQIATMRRVHTLDVKGDRL